MKSMSCRKARTEMEEAEPGQYLSQEARVHLAACEPCRAFRKERIALRELVGSVDMVPAPADFEYRLRARLTASKTGRGRSLFGFAPVPSAPAMALAASFALLVTAAVIFKQARPVAPAISRQPELAVNAPAPLHEEVSNGRLQAERTSVKGRGGADPLGSATALASNGARNPNVEPRQRGRSMKSLRSVVERSLPVTVTVGASNTGNDSLELSSGPAQVVSLVAVPAPATDRPVRVSLEDGRGATHTISLQPVTFGSQQLIERNGAGRTDASSTRGIW